MRGLNHQKWGFKHQPWKPNLGNARLGTQCLLTSYIIYLYIHIMYVCMYVCMYVINVCMYVINVCMYVINVCMYVCM